MSFTPYYFSPQFPSLHVFLSPSPSPHPLCIPGGMNMDLRRPPHAVGLDVDFFWPVQHPMEPQDEDRPVKCPMSASASSSPSSSIHIDGKGHEERVAAESSRKRSEQPTMLNNRSAAEPPVRAVRKRHHTLTCDSHISAEPALPPIPPPQTLTISQMLKQFDQV
ncbi:hypothetical protein V6N13_005214 [Hibiscus sabdariffa]|uniref:Uncharacterized protein n=2 Tax=Hibiscus sabdariffa TaxID=183260 RepID=A0ABR2ERB0_9ROSI